MDGSFLPWGLAFLVAGVVVGGLIIPFVLLGPGRSAVTSLVELPGATPRSRRRRPHHGIDRRLTGVHSVLFHGKPLRMGIAYCHKHCCRGGRPLAGNSAGKGHSCHTARFGRPGKSSPLILPWQLSPSLESLQENHSGTDLRNGTILVDTFRYHRRPHRRPDRHRLHKRFADGPPGSCWMNCATSPDSSDSMRRNRGAPRA